MVTEAFFFALHENCWPVPVFIVLMHFAEHMGFRLTLDFTFRAYEYELKFLPRSYTLRVKNLQYQHAAQVLRVSKGVPTRIRDALSGIKQP